MQTFINPNLLTYPPKTKTKITWEHWNYAYCSLILLWLILLARSNFNCCFIVHSIRPKLIGNKQNQHPKEKILTVCVRWIFLLTLLESIPAAFQMLKILFKTATQSNLMPTFLINFLINDNLIHIRSAMGECSKVHALSSFHIRSTNNRLQVRPPSWVQYFLSQQLNLNLIPLALGRLEALNYWPHNVHIIPLSPQSIPPPVSIVTSFQI